MICTGFMIIFEVATALPPFYGVRGPDVYSADNYIHVVTPDAAAQKSQCGLVADRVAVLFRDHGVIHHVFNASVVSSIVQPVVLDGLCPFPFVHDHSLLLRRFSLGLKQSGKDLFA